MWWNPVFPNTYVFFDKDPDFYGLSQETFGLTTMLPKLSLRGTQSEFVEKSETNCI